MGERANGYGQGRVLEKQSGRDEGDWTTGDSRRRITRKIKNPRPAFRERYEDEIPTTE